ncbi:NACHT domain-containing NTPase [Okeania sp. SIO2B3]|uniref:NACHT domain-containing protein n=1 Tax=Okeania sp. SIO2B3 TaxID=2607784 RepID=UPI0013C0D1BC|nr:NACHT domain-containing protein [Okeania sp. SIO2B3]NET41133.1 NACHT domain-containing protein [Okeania sp. SIO2B3]
MGNKDKLDQRGLTGTGCQNIREVKDKAKAAGFINEGTYINVNFADFLQGFLKFFRPEDREAKVRSKLLKGIKVEVVKRLEDSLQQNQLLINQYLELPMFSRKEAVGRFERKKIISLPPETKIIDVFYRQDVDGKLLILGKPGAGKTTTLLRLAKELIEEAENNVDAPVPMIFELSNWQEDKLSIGDWLIQYLKDFYGMSDRRLSRSLLTQRKILPLLDGLDELGIARQQLCIEKINDFTRENIGTCLVVCCRDEEYKQGNVRLKKLNGAYCLQSPTPGEIYRYLQSLGKVDLREVIQNNSQMWELAKIPLLLNIMVTAYQGEPIYNKEQLFAAYIEECLQREPTDVEEREKLFYSPEQTMYWLIFLAWQLEAEKQTEFMIENMQPSLLFSGQEWLYILISVLIYGLIFGLTFWLFLSLFLGILFGLKLGLFFGLILGLFLMQVETTKNIKPQKPLDFSWKNIKKLLMQENDQMREDYTALMYSIIFGEIFGTIFGIILWKNFGVFYGVFYGVLLLCLLSTNFWVVFALVYNLNTEIKSIETPNQGIRESLKNSLFTSVIAIPFFLLILYSIKDDILFGFKQNLLIYGLTLGFITGLSTGGLPCIQHFSLRLILWQNGLIPWNYARFLKYAAQRKLIQQVGGRYRFIHDSLRKHFVSYTR